MRTCTRCGFVSHNPPEDFHADALRKDGLRSHCKRCIKERDAKEYLENRERELANGVAWRAAHPEESRQGKLAWYYNHHEQELQRGARYSADHKEEIRVYHRTRYANNPLRFREESAEWRAKYPEKVKQQTQKRRADLHALPYHWTLEEKRFMYTYWQNACAVCGNEKGFYWTLAEDHWVPVTDENCPGTIATSMIPLCHGHGGCNNSKYNFDPHVWLVRRYGEKKAAKIEKTIATYFTIVTLRFPPPEPLFP